MANFVRRIESVVPRRAEGFGGKAKNLAALARAGFPVPAAYAIHSQLAEIFFENVLDDEDLPLRLLRAAPEEVTDARLATIRERVQESRLPREISQRLSETFDTLIGEGAEALAVRSSSTQEDQEASSAAGLHATVLGVTTLDGLYDAVRACWSSIFTPAAMAYLRSFGRKTTNPAVGVIVQALVPADVAGVLFTVNPLSGDDQEMVINASYGLGTLVMDGRVSPDTYRIDKSSGWIRDRVVGDKTLSERYLGGGYVKQEATDDDKRTEECLSPALLDALVTLGRRVETYFNDARDIEWAVAQETLYLLQARPVTALARPPVRAKTKKKQRARSEIVWSNVNVGEALPGVATPLTWSVLRDFSEKGFRRAFGALGCHVPRDAELVGSFRGRIYLNLSEFMEIIAQVPGVDPQALLALGGGGELKALQYQGEHRSSLRFVMRLPFTVNRYLTENLNLNRRIESFERSFEDEYGRLTAVDLRILSNTGLDRMLRRVERLLDSTGLLMLNVYGNLLACVLLLRGVLRLFTRDEAERLERNLLTGLTEVESAIPGVSLWHIAEMAKNDDATAQWITSRPLEELRIERLPAGPTRRALERFIEAHGYRGAREAEIAEKRWSEDPQLLFATLRAHLERKNQAITPHELEMQQRSIRDDALEQLERRIPLPARMAMRHLLRLVQRFTRLRERLRSHTVRVLSLYRWIALDASRRMAVRERGLLDDAAFFLSIEELHSVLKGDVSSVAHLVRRRRIQYTRDRALPAPPAHFVGYPPQINLQDQPGAELKGVSASGGRVEGHARVLTDPADAAYLEPGEILVAPYADVGWTPLFLVASAVVTELGGSLSHAAVVAREYGVPMVVNVSQATHHIQTGDRLIVDGEYGLIQIVTDPASEKTPATSRTT